MDMQRQKWSEKEMARRKRVANKFLMTSLVMFFVSLMPMYWVTCTKIFSEHYLVNNLGVMTHPFLHRSCC